MAVIQGLSATHKKGHTTKNAAPRTSQNYITFAELRIAAYGQWSRIHQSCGIRLITDSRRKHTPCPGCGGKDRFRVDRDYHNTGRWVCGGSGDFKQGDGFALLEHAFGWSAKEQLQAVADVLGIDGNYDRAALRRKADAHNAEVAALVAAKTERYRLDNNVWAAIDDVEGYLRYRGRCQRATNRAYAPLPDEVAAGEMLINALSAAYRVGVAL